LFRFNILELEMIAKPYSTVVVRVPAELRGVLDALAQARGEPLSLIVRDALRAAAGDRRVDPTVPQIMASGSAGNVR
jgi:predicted transcriptional regulator